MNHGEKTYIWQRPDWPQWRFDPARLSDLLAQTHRAQGHLMGRMQDIGIGLRDIATLLVLTQDVVKTSEIEGEQLNVEAVRSSIGRSTGYTLAPLK